MNRLNQYGYMRRRVERCPLCMGKLYYTISLQECRDGRVTGQTSERDSCSLADEDVLWTDYEARLSPSVPALLALETPLRRQAVADRVKL